MDPVALRTELEAVAKAKIFFGHQSVGRDLLAGVEDLATQSGVQLPITRNDSALNAVSTGIFHQQIGRNREPDSKLDAFTSHLQGVPSRQYDIAIMKFCYEDLRADAKQTPHALVERYAKSVASIRASQPQLRLIHATIPLRADPPGWKTPLKRLLGRATEEDADNALRNAFNAEVRARFSGEAIFDIAEAESTLPSGKRSFFTANDAPTYTLAQAYSADGGHLNDLGRRQVAIAFIHALARAIARGG